MELKIKFVRLTKDKINQMLEVKKQCWQETYTGIYPDDLLINFDNERHYNKALQYLNKEKCFPYLVIIKNKIIGYFTFSIKENSPLYNLYLDGLYIDNIYLLKSFQKLGIGKKIFNYLVKFAKKNNINKIYNCCNFYNENAKNFYKKMGGKIIYEDVNYENKQEDQLLYLYNIK